MADKKLFDFEKVGLPQNFDLTGFSAQVQKNYSR